MPFQLHTELKGESAELLQQYQQSKESCIRNRLVQLNIGLVRREAHRWARQSSESFEDLMQVGSLGLINAIERFDLAKGYAFSSFAIPYIRGEIQHYLRDRSATMRIPRKWQSLAYQARKAIQTLRTELHRQPTDLEISETLGISMSEWQEVKLATRNRSLLSLDAPVTDEETRSASLSDVLPDPKYRSFQLAEEDRIRLQQALQQLEERTRKILEFVFLQDLTQKETAERLGISSVTVSRRVKHGLQRLRHLMTASDED
ncbi:MAG: RNA polymerase sigma factor SigF [Leptolyngbyaceae cyanobacterium]